MGGRSAWVGEGWGEGDCEGEEDGEGSWLMCVDAENAGGSEELDEASESGLLRSGRRMSGWSFEDAASEGVSGLRFAMSRATAASICEDRGSAEWGSGGLSMIGF